MEVVVSQRQAWVRTGTHTVVFDHDREFPRFRKDVTGELKGLLRIWLTTDNEQPDKVSNRWYLGACRLCAGQSEWSDVLRLLRRLRVLVADAGRRRQVRQGVLATLRRYRDL